MEYMDNGLGNSQDKAVFTWLDEMLTPDVVGIRWQSGFFQAGVLGLLAPALERLANDDLDAMALIGSNDCETKAPAVHALVDFLRLPRPRARLGVVSYANGFFHPKTIHICFGSGREVAYVGSANLTTRGVNGLNVEAGITLDTDQGDSEDVLAAVKDTVADWFGSRPEGLYIVNGHGDVDDLERRGILTDAGTARAWRTGSGVARADGLRHRSPGHLLPRLLEVDEEEDGVEHADDDEVGLIDDVLVAELVGPGRWSQSAFPKWFVDNFFEVPPGDDLLHLLPVTPTGVGDAESVPCGYKRSRNWYYELHLATVAGEYPPDPPKPIGVFHRIAPQTCRYTIIMPDDVGYEDVSACLAANIGHRPTNQLRRTIIPAQTLADAWTVDWFFRP